MLATTLQNISLADAGICAILGYMVVFFGLILLLIVTILFSKLFTAGEKKNQPIAVVEKPFAPPELKAAPGSAGQLKLHNVEPKTAAMLMAIVANKMGKPINELRFISIKEVE